MSETNVARIGGGLLRRRQCLVPTWRGWLLILMAGAALAFFAVKNAHSFLAISDPCLGEALVVEGWVPDYVFTEAVAEFKRGQYSKLYVTGGPLDQGTALSEYKTYADLGAAVLVRLGLAPNSVQAAPAPRALEDRTFASAVALKQWLRDHGMTVTRFNVISLGVHSRRSRLLFKKALGGDAQVGIMSVADQRYDAKHWWRTSVGFKQVMDETIAYGYTKFYFIPCR